MENSSRLLERHYASLRSRHVLVVGADDRALWQLPSASLQIHCDDVSIAGAAAMLPPLSASTDLIIVVLPKAREQLAFWLAALQGQLQQSTELWLVGPASGGIRGGVTLLKQVCGDASQLDSARHCKLFSAMLAPAAFELSAWQKSWRTHDIGVCSYPGVFSHGRADAGTELLLDTLTDAGVSGAGSALDIGCGAGVISAWLAQRKLLVTAVDVSATAIAATEQTLIKNALSAQLMCSDLYQQVQGRFDLVVTNPPFHDGTRRTTEITRQLIDRAPSHLRAGGSLWMVANQGLPYGDWLRAAFSDVQVAAENRQFRVWHCQ